MIMQKSQSTDVSAAVSDSLPTGAVESEVAEGVSVSLANAADSFCLSSFSLRCLASSFLRCIERSFRACSISSGNL